MLDYKVSKNKIIINNNNEFNIKHILECGQVFRYEKNGTHYKVFSLDKCAHIYLDDKFRNIIETEDTQFFVNYFDLHTDYGIIKSSLEYNDILKKAIEFGSGIRILRQNNIEALFYFIISANNNIARIKKIINAICETLGKNCGDYYAFPSIESLAGAGEKFYTDIGAGYRAKYLHNTANMIKDGFDLESIRKLPTDVSAKHLIELAGVGPKVADCVLLFGYHKTDVFPVDTWIKKVYTDYFGTSTESVHNIRVKLIENFKELSGYAQQYLFYYKRSLDRKGV